MIARPTISGAPGLAWRKRADGWVATWVARTDKVDAGFQPQTQRLIHFTSEPTAEQIGYVQDECTRLQNEMLAFGAAGKREFGGTWRALTDAYETDPDSPFHAIRHKTRKNYLVWLKKIRQEKGDRSLAGTKGRDFRRWYDYWRWPNGKDGDLDQPYTAHGILSMIRNLVNYGLAFEVEEAESIEHSECFRLSVILSKMDFEKGGARKEALSYEQAVAIIAEANRRGRHSIALTQALQTDLVVHQKDCIGEWVPLSEPGLSDVTWRTEKWLYGIRWEEITPALLLTHTMAKSRKGKVLEFDLNLYPLVMAELTRIAPERRAGPLVVDEKTGLPWSASSFAKEWRSIAKAVGVPDHVWNMDSRAGGTTETIEATGGDLEAARKQAGHTNIKTTQRYSRGDLKSNSKVAVLRSQYRSKDAK